MLSEETIYEGDVIGLYSDSDEGIDFTSDEAEARLKLVVDNADFSAVYGKRFKLTKFIDNDGKLSILLEEQE